jgi:arginyl-tRNA synthetase
MKNPWLTLKEEIARSLGVEPGQIEEPDKFGDLAFPCFSLAKAQKRNPAEVAKELAGNLKIDMISKVDAIGPFLNFYVDWSKFSKIIIDSIDEKYGSWEESETVMMDVFQANPFKSFHIGHVRNAVLGEAIRRILEKTGKKTSTANYNGDVGIHVARWLLYFNENCGGKIPDGVDFAKFGGEVYAKASQLSKDDPGFEERAQNLNRKIDQRDPTIMAQWKELRDMFYADFERIRGELDVKVDKVIPESDCEQPGKKTVLELFSQGKLVKSDGAIGIDLKELGFFILLKSDGTAIYATKDIGLLELKRKYFKFDRMAYVVGSEQDLYFKQLFKAEDILGLYPASKSKHISYGLVSLKEGKMSSRLGNVILYEELKEMMVKRVLEEMEDRDVDFDREEVALKIALGAIKFQMLDIENNKMIKFDWEQALDINGRSGPYIQYSLVRAKNIINKESCSGYDVSLLKEESEIGLLKKMAMFPDIVKHSADNYSPNVIANYLFELAQLFNSFYQSVQVLKAGDDLKNARLKLVEAFTIVFKSGMELLGIPVLERM